MRPCTFRARRWPKGCGRSDLSAILEAELGIDAAQAKVHNAEGTGGGVALLTVDAYITELATKNFVNRLAFT